MVKEYKELSPEQVEHFMEHGWVRIPQAFTAEKAYEFTHDLWVRLGYDPNDKSTWKADRTNMPWHKREPVATFAPKAWAAMCDLLGGEERIDPKNALWSDGFIVNLGTDELEDGHGHDVELDPRDLLNWHVDGDFFVHFLDSPEQGLLVIPVFSDIGPRGGGTYICPDAIEMIANYLAEHPEGVVPTGTPTHVSFTPQGSDVVFDNHVQIRTRKEFVQTTGKLGDVILMHPFMMHSFCPNFTRIPRIISNPAVALKEPFNFNRENPDDFSVVELKTLKALGKERFDFKITKERRGIVPLRVARQQKMKEEELERLRKLKEKQELEQKEKAFEKPAGARVPAVGA